MLAYTNKIIAHSHIQHFWHFMAGYFMPVAIQPDQGKTVYVHDCGEPMNKLWESLTDRKIIVGIPKEIEPKVLPNYDKPSCGKCTQADIDKFREVWWACHKKPKVTKNYMLIDRGNPPAYYKKERRASASKRRHIVNVSSLLEKLKKQYPFELHYLETLTLQEQANLYHKTNVIVCQHGASMFNLIFCREGVSVVELASDRWEYYRKWANLCGVKRHTIKEPFKVEPNSEKILKAINFSPDQ